MDISTLLGIVIGFGALVGSLLIEGGQLQSLYNLPAMMIVFGGTFGAAFISFPKEHVLNLPKLIKQAFFGKATMDELATIALMTRLAEKARREGLLSLEEETEGIDDGFLKRGTQLIVDGADPDMVRGVLQVDLLQMQHRHEASYGVLEAMGGYSPTMGIIGTVMGLVRVLGELSDPSSLGPAIAVAFIATFYGVASANLLWLPLASKLKRKSDAESTIRELMLEGLLSIQAGENPRIVQEKLLGFLAPYRRTDAGRRAEGEAA
ncbi:MAG: flagellar motor protein [Chloroflexota bacterium]